MRCIPRELLIHTAEIKSVLSEDCFGVKEFSDSVNLKYIRIDREQADIRTGHAVSNDGNALLIYDAVTSVPRNFDFSTGQVVSFDGVDFVIKTVKRLYDKNRLHHIEVLLEEIS